MAEFALGLTKAAVEGTLSRVKSAIEEETKIKEKVQHDLVFITGEFQMMQSFLNVANKERAKNEVVRTWVRQLRDLAFDVEDCVEFVVHLDKKSSWWWRMVPSCVAPPQRVDEAAAEIKLLKARVEDVSQRNMRYNLISDSGSHCRTIMPPEQQASATTKPSAFHNLREVWNAAWKIRDMGNLQELITREGTDLEVISIWGSTRGDLGATPILREAYYDPKICQEFKSRAWVKVVHPFNPDEFLGSLLTRLYASSHTRYEGVDNLKQGELMQQVKEHKYLLVLEQVSSVAEWDDIRMCLPDSQNGSRIIMATQDLGIALLSAGQPYLVSELCRFSDGQSTTCMKVSGRRSDMGELKYQIRRGGVTAVVDYGRSKSTFVKRLYQSIMHKDEDFDGVKFGTHRWVHVVDPFDLTDFSRRLFMDLSPYKVYDIDDDFNTLLFKLSSKYHYHTKKYVEEVLKMGDLDLIEGCRRFLCKEDCLIIIDGLLHKSDWYRIKSTFLSKLTKGSSIVVIARNGRVATDCVDHEDRVLESELGHVVVSRKEEAHGWLKSFKPVRHGDFILPCINPGLWSVWGIAGVGKSALVRNEYYDQMVSYRLPFQMYSWVDVPDPFNLMDFSRRLLLDFHSDNLQAKETAILGIIEGQDPIQGCRKFMSEYKCLVVIDGLRSQDDWDLIKAALLSGPTRGSVVVVTNEASVARHCADQEERVINVKCLESDEALRLWQQEITSMGEQLTHDEMELSKLILAKCGGLPKIITALGEYFKLDHPYLSKYNNFKSINDDFMSNIENNPRFHSLRGLFSWMQSYFEACKDSLKPCIFYLSVFSAEDNIKRRRLLRRWIAEGYSRDTSSGTALENGERLFSELVKLSIIQQTSSKSMCQVNGFFHQYIISRPMEDNLVFALEGSCSTNSQRAGQHLTIRSSWDRDKIVFESIDFSRLRSLTVFGEWMSFFISTNINMRLLRVLDLEDTSGLTNDDLEQIGKLLPRLKFLSLRGCIEVTRLPDSVGDLRQLQTLDARHTSIVILPHAIIKLQKLQYLRVGTSNEPWDEGCMVTSLPAADEGKLSTPAGDHAGPSQPTTTAPTPSEDGSTGLTQPAPTPSEDGGSKGPKQPAPTRSKSRTVVSSRLSMLCGRHKLGNGGVEVPTEFGGLTTLHTLGIVNVSVAGGKEILKELKNITQLRKLGLRGINRENWQELCSAVPCYKHLETLSVQVDKDKDQSFFCCFDDISQPPKTLKSLKLYGHVHKLPAWIKQLDNLKKLDLEMTITTQEGMHGLAALPSRHVLRRLCVKPINNGELQFILPEGDAYGTYDVFSVLEIECTSRLKVTFGYLISGGGCAEVLKVNCSSGSSLEISGLENLKTLKEIWLKGSYGDELKQYLQRHIDQLPGYRPKPVLKLVQPRSS
ncbi:hypothetical protein ACQ4PT_067870 [Festuca glaucescens]